MSQSRIIVATTVLFAVAVSAKLEAAGDPVVLPGLWETTSHLPGLGQDVTVSRDCITPEEARGPRFLSAGHSGRCKFGDRMLNGGRIDLSMTCIDDDGSWSSGRTVGTYMPTSWATTSRMQTVVGGRDKATTIVAESRRIAASCPVGSDG